jgi:hypothetical protein
MINEIREVLEKHKENIPVVAMAELLAVLDEASSKQKLKYKICRIADIQNCGNEDCYPWKRQDCIGCVNRRVSVKSVLKIIDAEVE